MGFVCPLKAAGASLEPANPGPGFSATDFLSFAGSTLRCPGLSRWKLLPLRRADWPNLALIQSTTASSSSASAILAAGWVDRLWNARKVREFYFPK